MGRASFNPEEFVGHEWNGYDGKIRGMDDAFKTLVEGLEAYGLSDRTLVAVVADHGTEFLEHGGHSHGHTVYGELNRVPMLLWSPGYVPKGRKVDATVQTIDLMPTLLELSGIPTPENIHGTSLRALFSDDGSIGWNRPAFTDLPARYTWGEQPRMTALISEGWKLVRIDDPSGARYQLYDYGKDPMDLHDVSGEHPDVVTRLSGQIERFREFAAAARLDDAKAPDQMDSAELERLRSLGYVQ